MKDMEGMWKKPVVPSYELLFRHFPYESFKDEAQTASFKDPVRTAGTSGIETNQFMM
jgi:hypothetical protein